MEMNGATQCISIASCDVRFVHKSSVIQLRDVPRQKRLRAAIDDDGSTKEKSKTHSLLIWTQQVRH
jgi:hypothetical protein